MNRRHFHEACGRLLATAVALPGMEFLHTIQQANAQTLRSQNKSVIISCGWAAAPRRSIHLGPQAGSCPTGGEFQRNLDLGEPASSICEHMPKVAEQFRHLNVIRSLTTTEGDHGRGTQLMHTAFTPNPAVAFPSMGSVAAKKAPELTGYREISLPNYISSRHQRRRPRLPRHEVRPVPTYQHKAPGNMPENVRGSRAACRQRPRSR